MDWVLAVKESNINMAKRIDEDGNTVHRFNNGSAILISKNIYVRPRELKDYHVDGYHDWEPL